MPAQVAVTIIDEVPGRGRQVAFKLELWSETYKIHLGSGNVLMEPGSQYLCIVPDRGVSAVHLRDVWLPFEGDSGLVIILRKALMLAADTKITDPLIVQQIRRL